ncbi:uncharacterized protein LOC136083594 isoform X4 [Hydra vulgaris]|uniref:Uncharacterized protein LOC136083594 isoform X4 n=1 Tax=Hydra vulgaris TaxID=6087 RepID=A0ABM4CBN9_HYDVU
MIYNMILKYLFLHLTMLSLGSRYIYLIDVPPLEYLKLNPDFHFNKKIHLNESSYNKMTECELSLHFNCILRLDTLKNLNMENCNLNELEKCLNYHKKASICKINDPDTLHAVDQLQNEIKSASAKKKLCKRKYFIHKLQDYFKVLGVESSQIDEIEYSGESNDDESDDLENLFSEEGFVSQVISNEDLGFWKEKSKQINNAKKRLYGKMIFFDDRKYIKQRKVYMNNFIKKEWKNLIRRYAKWFKSI